MIDQSFYAIIPAGGSGTRLWPLSRANKPKFLLPLPGPRTMIQETVHRLKPITDPTDRYIITGAAHAAAIARQVPEIPDEQIIIEPTARGTGPAIGLGVAIAARRDPDAITGSFAADHVVEQPEAFIDTVKAAIEVAREGYLVTIGIPPGHPETGYGYIRSGTSIGQFNGLPAYKVVEFKEKPDLPTAKNYVESGEYLWNASMFVWKASTLLEEMHRWLPDVYSALERIADVWNTPSRETTFARIWPSIESVTIDHGILERSDRVAVVPGDFGWSDLGDWHGLGELLSLNDEQNAVVGCDVIGIDSHDTVVYGNNRTVALVGVDNLIVVDTPDVILVCNRSRAQSVKDIVEALKGRNSTELL